MVELDGGTGGIGILEAAKEYCARDMLRLTCNIEHSKAVDIHAGEQMPKAADRISALFYVNGGEFQRWEEIKWRIEFEGGSK